MRIRTLLLEITAALTVSAGQRRWSGVRRPPIRSVKPGARWQYVQVCDAYGPGLTSSSPGKRTSA
jgi:hypothetical protein